MTDADTSLPIAPDELCAQECARRTSLVALGITPLVSRADPVRAKPARRYEAPKQSDSGSRARAGTEEAETSGAQLRAIVSFNDEMPLSKGQRELRAQPDTVPPKAVSISKAANSPEKQAPISLLIVTSGDVLWLEVLEDQLLRKEQLQLIAAMARAIRGPSTRCDHQQFDWPLAGQTALVATQSGMAEVFSGFLQRLTTDHSTNLVVLMGSFSSLPDTGLPVHHIPSTLDMLQDGTLKQTAWATLKPLCHSA